MTTIWKCPKCGAINKETDLDECYGEDSELECPKCYLEINCHRKITVDYDLTYKNKNVGMYSDWKDNLKLDDADEFKEAEVEAQKEEGGQQ